MKQLFKILKYSFAGVAFLFLLLVVLLQIPAVQTWTASRVIDQYFSDEAKDLVTFERLKIGVSGKVIVSDAHIKASADKEILSVDEIKIRVGLLSLFGNYIKIKRISIAGLDGHVYRKKGGEFNIQPLLSLISNTDTTKSPTTANPLNVNISIIELSEIQISYHDSLTQLFFDANLGHFKTNMAGSDISELHFSFDKVRLSETGVTLALDDRLVPNPEETLDTTAKLPVIEVGSIKLDSVFFRLDQYNKNGFLLADIDKLEGKDALVDINEELVQVGSLFLKNSLYRMNYAADTINVPEDSEINANDKSDINFSGGWTVLADEIEGENNNVYLHLAKSDISPDKFEPTSMWFEDINFEVKKPVVRSNEVNVEIKSLSSRISDYINLKDVKLIASVSNHELSLDLKSFETDSSKIAGTIMVNTLLSQPVYSETDFKKLNIKGKISLFDINFFLPKGEMPRAVSELGFLTPDINIFSEQDRIEISTFTVAGNDKSRLSISGNILNTTSDSAILNISVDTIRLSSNLISYLTGKNFNYGLGGKLTINGNPDSLMIGFRVNESGQKVSGNIKLITDSSRHYLAGNLDGYQLDPFFIFSDTLLSPFNARIGLKATISKQKSMVSGDLEGYLAGINYDSVFLDTIFLNADYSNNQLQFSANHLSEELKFEANVSGQIDSIGTNLNYLADISGIKFRVLKEKEKQALIEGSLSGNLILDKSASIKLDGQLKDITILTDKESIEVPKIEYNYSNNADSFRVALVSEGVDFSLKSNMEFNDIPQKLQELVINNLRDSIIPPQKDKFLLITTTLGLSEDYQMLLSSMLLDSIRMDSLSLFVDLQKETVNLNAFFETIGFKKMAISNLGISHHQDKEKQHSKISMDEVKYQNVLINPISWQFIRDGQKINSDLSLINDQGNRTLYLPLYAEITDTLLNINVHDSLIIGAKKWDIPSNNIAAYNFEKKKWSRSEITITNKDQVISFNESATDLSLQIKNFKINTATDFISINDSNLFSKANLSGNIKYSLNGQNWLFSSELWFNKIFWWNNESMGNMRIYFNQISRGNNQLVFKLTNQNDSVHYTGNFGELSENYHTATISVQDIARYEQLLDTGRIHLRHGNIVAELDARLSGSRPKIGGSAHLKNTKLNIPEAGSNFYIEDELFTIDNELLVFREINISDENHNELILNGSINAENYPELYLDLAVKSDKFQLINSTSQQNESAYGLILLSADIKVRGPHLEPKIDAVLKIKDQTNITIKMPEKDYSVSGSKGVVVFSDEEEIKSDSVYIAEGIETIKGKIESNFSFGASTIKVSFNKGAKYTVVTDPLSGDVARFSLAGGIEYKSLNKDVFELNGNVKVVDGSYEMSFYQLIKKDFIIEPNSTIYFAGPLSNATMDISASHIVRTNSLGLMAGETIGSSANEQALYSQRLPYHLYFNISGPIFNPNVNFALDLPDDYKGNSPMIASRLNRLASPENEQELNMQVFALLVTGGFIAQNSGGGSGSTDVAMATARNSLNSILSQQLNNITSDNIQFVDVNFGLNTYDDYARRGGKTTTDLDVQISKKLFDDKVSLEVESRINLDGTKEPGQSTSNYNTDYKLYYSLDESDRIRLKAYNVALYDLFDGDITNAGIGIMFSKDFEGRKRKNYVETDSVKVHE